MSVISVYIYNIVYVLMYCMSMYYDCNMNE